MKVSGIGTTSGPGQARKAGKTDKASSNAFAQTLSDTFEAMEEAHAVESPNAVTGLDALLLVQGVGDTLEREARQRMVRRGEDLLAGLEDLRHDLLIGAVPKERLVNLARLVRVRRENVADPRLAGILDEIELRVEVELAKLAPRGSSL